MSCYQLESSLGYSVTKQNNIDLIEDDKLIFIVGNTVQILDIKDNASNYGKFNEKHIVIHGHSNGIGAFAIHPNKQCFAFGEIGHVPNIFIYSYPQLTEMKILSNGTQRKYSDMEFNANGNYLATIGGAPDHMLTIWDWKVGTVILRAKAFSQDVFNVRFSPYNQNRLITSGTGHIRFWEMASTFTGLKLQGKIGKFGEVDLSDVWSFVEFESGKVLSGSEHGNILMWHSDLIQFVVKPDTDTTCHDGNIIYIDLYDKQTLISAGTDGCIRFWDCDNIEFFEPSDDLPYYPLHIKHEITVNTKCKLMSMIKYKDLYWIIQDAMGNLYKLCMNNEYSLGSIVQFHGLFVTSINCANESHSVITSGKDGSIRFWDLQTQKCDFIKQLQSPINLLLPLKIINESTNNNNKYFMAFCDDGVVRVIQKGINAFVLKYSLRIHDQSIVFAAISNNSQYLATITETQLFFSQIAIDKNENITIEPIGFVLLKHKLHKIYWNMDNNTLYSYHKQNIITYTRPTNDAFDTSSTFQIELNPNIIPFTPFLTEEDSKVEIPQPTETEPKSEHSETKEEKTVEEHKQKENILDKSEWSISCILPFYENNTDLLIAIKCSQISNIPNYYKWNISEHKIIQYNPTHFTNDYITNFCYSFSKQFLLISTQKSTSQIRQINNNSNYANVGIHSDWQNPNISNIPNILSLTFDDRMLLSAASDGSLFCHLFDCNKLKHPLFDANFEFEYVSENSQNISEKNIGRDTNDMTGNDYSVQGEKIQRELDHAKSAAERYKAQLRQELSVIRSKKEEILNQTKEFIAHDLGLTLSDLDIDTNLRTRMAEQLETDKETVRKEMAWNSEKIKLGLSKLENAFLKTVTVENIEVSSFRSNHTVSTFRTPVLPDWVERDITKVHHIINAESKRINESVSKHKTNSFHKTESKNETETDTNAESPKDDESEKKENRNSNPKPSKMVISAAKQKKMVREKLKTALEELQNEKPSENTDDPRDIEAINYAKANIGDYKLKSDPKYVVPESAHMNASQKRKQMILLLESVTYIKMGLNERVLALRDLKKRIVENVTNDTQRLNEINSELFGPKNVTILKPPRINKLKEWPEQRYTFDETDLNAFIKVLQQEIEDKSGNNNAFGGGNKTEKNIIISHSEQKMSDETKNENAYFERLQKISVSDLQNSQNETMKQRLNYEKTVLLSKISATIETFDSAVSELRVEKSKLINDLKLTNLKFLTLLKELNCLSSFEDREIALNGKLLKSRTEKAKVVVDLTETQTKLTQKLEEIRLWQERDKKIQKEFDHICGARNPFYDELKKIFKRKMKRHKKKESSNSKSAALSESESSESESDSDSNEDSCSDAYDSHKKSDSNCDDSCPKDCDNITYEKVMELREKRLDQSEILVEFEKSVHELKLANIALINKEKNIDKALFESEKEIELFENEKQRELNKIIVSVPLQLSQIRNDGRVALQSEINDSFLIFELQSLERLKQRINEQKSEKATIKKDYFELKKLYKTLHKKINTKQAEIDVEKRKCEQVQFLKYGRLIPLELLDLSAVTNPECEQMKYKLATLKKEYKSKYKAWDQKVSATKRELSDLIMENTHKLGALTRLKQDRNDLKSELSKILEIDVIKDSKPNDKKRNRELQKLVQVAKTQANEIDVLKAEIHMLQRKGGMLYALPEI